ncbi:MAG: hypothetical protein AAF724_16860 [Pseudomonadota bacterium]
MYVAILIRRLKPGKTYDDFIAAWYPEKGFDMPVAGPDLCVNIADEREIAAIAYLDVAERPSLEAVLERVAEQEAKRHTRIDHVIEATSVRGIYEVKDRFDFSTDETVAATVPGRASR